MTTEITTTAGVTAVVILITTLLLLVIAATKVFSRSPSPDINDGGAVVPDIIPHASSSSSSSTSKAWKYDVFLSFRGEDTRKTLVDHLYFALQQHHILTYKDDVTLDRGDTIGPALLTAIRESHISLIIFSENYADSSWCLDELSYIMKCKEEDSGQIVIPIFYNVDPSDVRKQRGQFGKAFAKLRKLSKNKNKIESWEKALVDASNIAGWEPMHVANGHEATCIQEIVGSILDKLSSLDSTVEDDNLVGIETRLQQLRSHLRIGSGGVRMVGIWGLGGAGKTTLATSLYMKLKSSGQFHGCCFVENIREASKQQHGLKGLQEKILSTVFNKQMQVESVELGKHEIKKKLCRRNVLIVLDDVDHLEHLEALAGCHNWFGNGSRIIITTREQQVLESHRVDKVCPVSLLSNDEAIQLFKRHAYREHNPVEDYEKLSLQVITYANHLPLALKILGAFLYGKDLDEWISTLARLKDHPEMGIVEKLKISYDGLKPVEKELFLDIACFHKGRSKDDAMEILDACGFYPAIGVKVLIQKALITVSVDGYFDMHDLVEEMADYIVRGEHPKNPEKHSRIWREEDIQDICSSNAKTENNKIEAIQCYAGGRLSNFIMLVSNMKKLRFLIVGTRGFDEGPSFLSNELRYIKWDGYPASPFPESFQLRKLVVLRMKDGLQKELWKGYMYLPCLKVLKLSWMEALVRTPDFGGLPCLQKLKLGDCYSLEEIHQSLGNHSSLVHVSVSWCKKLKRFPTIVKMDKLKILKILDCRALVEFPKIEANMDSLVKLSLGNVGREILPTTIQKYCTNLTSLSVGDEKLIGMRTRLQELRSLLRIGSGGVRMVGIWGLGGAGKTTLATSLYKKFKISGQFHGCCFVENIREAAKQQHGLKGLQEKILSTVFNKQMQVESVEIGKHKIKNMLCRRNVLIVLDDVDHLEQLEALAGCHNWFGNGSRIIITTRDEQVLKSHRVDLICPVSLLSNDEAIRLFKRHAYREHNPIEDYEKLSLQVITYANHLPLALKILGAFLYGKDLDEWISTLARLKDHPEMGIVEKLKIS